MFNVSSISGQVKALIDDMNKLKQNVPAYKSLNLLNTQMVKVLGKIKNLQYYAFHPERSLNPEAGSSKTGSGFLFIFPCFRLTKLYNHLLLYMLM